MEHEVDMHWSDGMAFSAEVNDHEVIFDAAEAQGGQDKGPRPKPMLLASLAACTAMDVVSLLKKMRVDHDSFNVHVVGRLTEEHPKYYDKIHIVYNLAGKEIQEAKVKKAIDLSQDRYCGVSAMLRKAAEITYEIRLN